MVLRDDSDYTGQLGGSNNWRLTWRPLTTERCRGREHRALLGIALPFHFL